MYCRMGWEQLTSGESWNTEFMNSRSESNILTSLMFYSPPRQREAIYEKVKAPHNCVWTATIQDIRNKYLEWMLLFRVIWLQRLDSSLFPTKSWIRKGSFRQFRGFASKYFFGLYFKYFLTWKLWNRGDIAPVVPPGYAPGGNRILIAGYRPMQAFVIERSLSEHRFGNSN